MPGPYTGGVIAEIYTASAAFFLEGILFAVAAGILFAYLVVPSTEQLTAPPPKSATTAGPSAVPNNANGSRGSNGSNGSDGSNGSHSRNGGGGGGSGGGGSGGMCSWASRLCWRDASGSGSGSGGGQPLCTCGFSREAYLTAPVLVVLSFARATRELLLPLKAVELGASSSTVGAVTAASFAVDTALVPVAGFVMDRYGRKYAGTPALAFSAFGFVLLALADTLGTAVGASVLLGLGMGMSNGWIQTVGADLAPDGARPQFLGMWNLIMGLGTAVGPLVTGAVAQWRNMEVATLLAALITAAGAAWYVALGAETLPSSHAAALI